MAGTLADDVELALERIGDHDPCSPANEHLPDDWLDATDRIPQAGVVPRNIPPAEQYLSLILDGAFDLVFTSQAGRRLLWKEDHSDAVLAHGRQGDAGPGHFLAEEGIRNLNQDSRPVASLGVGTHSTPMGEIPQNLQPLLDYGMALGALDMGYETHATGVMFIGWVV